MYAVAKCHMAMLFALVSFIVIYANLIGPRKWGCSLTVIIYGTYLCMHAYIVEDRPTRIMSGLRHRNLDSCGFMNKMTMPLTRSNKLICFDTYVCDFSSKSDQALSVGSVIPGISTNNVIRHTLSRLSKILVDRKREIHLKITWYLPCWM